MGRFHYKAMNAAGTVLRGEMEASGLVDLEQRLYRMQLDLIHARPHREGKTHVGRSVPRRELIDFCFHLEQLLRAGIPLQEALIELRDSTSHARMKAVIGRVVNDVQRGIRFSDALQPHPDVFGNVMCALIQAGEMSGSLEQVLHEHTTSLKRDAALLAETRRLMAYPLIVAAVLLIVTTVLLLAVVPELTNFFRQAGIALPLSTRVLQWLSASLRAYWPGVLLLFSAIPMVLRFAPRLSPSAALRLDTWLLSLPLTGDITRKLIAVRFSGLLALMYGAGIPLIESVRHCEGAMGNLAMSAAASRARALMIQGTGVAAAFEQAGLFPSLVLRMIRLGESTGALDRALHEASAYYLSDVQHRIARVQAALEPLLTVFLGLLLLAVAASLFGPVYDMLGQLKI